jgi:hypothetical protein
MRVIVVVFIGAAWEDPHYYQQMLTFWFAISISTMLVSIIVLLLLGIVISRTFFVSIV